MGTLVLNGLIDLLLSKARDVPEIGAAQVSVTEVNVQTSPQGSSEPEPCGEVWERFLEA